MRLRKIVGWIDKDVEEAGGSVSMAAAATLLLPVFFVPGVPLETAPIFSIAAFAGFFGAEAFVMWRLLRHFVADTRARATQIQAQFKAQKKIDG